MMLRWLVKTIHDSIILLWCRFPCCGRDDASNQSEEQVYETHNNVYREEGRHFFSPEGSRVITRRRDTLRRSSSCPGILSGSYRHSVFSAEEKRQEREEQPSTLSKSIPLWGWFSLVFLYWFARRTGSLIGWRTKKKDIVSPSHRMITKSKKKHREDETFVRE
jgi:hypothetical protein